MQIIFEEKKTQGTFIFHHENEKLRGKGILSESAVNTIVFNWKEDQTVYIDDCPYLFPRNSILTLVSNQNFKFVRSQDFIAVQFNREFYCLLDHDTELGCIGFLFYGVRHPMIVNLSEKEVVDFNITLQLFFDELQKSDAMQAEMLRVLLKSLVISLTRIAKNQLTPEELTGEKLDVIRMFSISLEQYYKTQHGVQFYADLLNKSPKTLSNLFSLHKYPPPSKIIQERIVLETKRYLLYTDKTVKEISYLLGFVNPAHFSRFLKKCTGHNAAFFRKISSKD
jgi:AraC family transcriptional activator of pobA